MWVPVQAENSGVLDRVNPLLHNPTCYNEPKEEGSENIIAKALKGVNAGNQHVSPFPKMVSKAFSHIFVKSWDSFVKIEKK